MPGDVYCTGCDAFRDRTELGRCIDGVYVSCEMCEDYHELLAEWDNVNERLRAVESAIAKADKSLDLIISANLDASFDMYLRGYAGVRWEAIQSAANAYDEAREASRALGV